jgi:hypothetical protein
LTLNEVLAWKDIYGDLVGKNRDVAIERYGPAYQAEASSGSVLLHWDASHKTAGREVQVLVSTSDPPDVIFAAHVYPRADETLDVMEILRKAPLFEFESGVFSNSTDGHFSAKKRQAGNETHTAIQFLVKEQGLVLERVYFFVDTLLSGR